MQNRKKKEIYVKIYVVDRVEIDESATSLHFQNKVLAEFEHDSFKTRLIDLLGLIQLLHQMLAQWSGDARIFYHQIFYDFHIMQASCKH